MQEAASSLRAWISETRLTAGRVTGSLVLEAGRRFDFIDLPLRVIRPADLLVLEFRFVNFRREGARLVRADAAKPAYLIAIHQPQSFGEQAFLEIGDQKQKDLANDPKLAGMEPPPPSPVRPDADPLVSEQVAEKAQIRIAHPSRVAYEMPAQADGIDRNLESLLRACRKWPLSLDHNAQIDPGDFRLEGSIDLTWMGAYLREVARTAWTALESAIGPAGRRALDAVAIGLAEAALAGIATGRATDGRALRGRADSQIRRVIPSRKGDDSVRVDQVLAALYVRAEASREALARVQFTPNRDPFILSRLPPDIFILFLTPHPPSERETAIDMPYRLIASPLATAGFAHALAPVTHRDRTELWHSRLGSRVTRNGLLEIDDRLGVATETGGWDGEKLRFLWSPDYPDGERNSFTQPLDYLDRRMLVKLTSGFNELRQDGKTPFVPRAVWVRRMMLTAMGGDLEAHRKFDPRPQEVDLSAWTHRSAIGRDYYVRVEYSGFLFPFGHRATLVKLTERKFQWRDINNPVDRMAVLRQRFFIIVRDRMIAYPGIDPQPHQGRSLPFEQVICALEGATPDLDEPGKHLDDRVDMGTPDVKAERRMAFWPARGGGVAYKFPLVGIDGAGRKIPFEMPLIFISELKNRSADIPFVTAHWNGGGKAAERRIPTLAGQMVRMAPVSHGSDVDVPLNETEFRAIAPLGPLQSTPARTLQQFPLFGEMKVKLAAIERLTGVAREERIKYFDPYLDSGFNAGGAVFAEIIDPTKLGFGGDRPSSSVGGIATPDLQPSGLSARHGVTSGSIGTIDSGQFDPAQYFPDAKLLGFFSLKALLKTLPLNDSGDTPKLMTVELPDRIRTTFSITQTLVGTPPTGLILGAGGPSVFTLETVIDAPLAAAPPETSVTGTLTHFKISLANALILHFDRLRFFTRPGAKPDVDVDLNPDTGVTFGGPLEFINKLKDFIPANGFSDPPNLDVTPAGITAGYSLGLPAIQVGIMSLSNISLGAAFTLPFTGDPPTARFNFAERQNTFNLTVSMFGGGGFVALVAGTDKIREIEAQLDFGAQIAINLGVASGSVYVKGGFYFHYTADMVKFEGFVEMGGRLSVLGLISVSLTFHLGLTYELLQKSGNGGIRASRLFGQATLTVEIEILFFSASVDVTVEKTFIGSEADPTFLDLVPDQARWDDYCAAYA